MVKTQQLLKWFKDWQEEEHKETMKIDIMPCEKLDNYISNFLFNIRKNNSEKHEPDSLTSYIHPGIPGRITNH